MLLDHLSIALKEWAVVQRSLLEQHQIIVIRKGGISEETGDFELKASQFLLFPSYQHESERLGDLQPCFEKWLHDEKKVLAPAGTIRIECACEVTDIVRVTDRNQLIKLMPQHIWSKQFIDGRYEWEPYKPVSVLLLRAYRLKEPKLIADSRSYAGCRSWVNLEDAIETIGAKPSIPNDRVYARREQLTKDLLNGQ